VNLNEFIKTEFDFTNKKNIGEMELCGIIVHSGSYMMPEKSKSNLDKTNKRVVYTVNGGHYVVYFKNNDKWYLYNDLGATISLLEEDPTTNKEVKKNCTFLVYFKKNADAAGENSTMTKIRNDEIFMDFIQEQLQIINEELAPGTSSKKSSLSGSQDTKQLENIKKAEKERPKTMITEKEDADNNTIEEATTKLLLNEPQYLEKLETEAKEKADANTQANEIVLAQEKQQNRVKDFYNKLNKNTYKTIQINKMYETKLTAQNAINKDTNTNIFNFDTKDIGKDVKVGMLILLIPPTSQEADDNDVYMIKGFGSIIVDRNFEKNYPENTIIIFYSVEKQERANIITELLKKYNEEYDVEIEKKYEEIKNIQEKSSTKYNENLFRQILINVDKTQKHIENVKIDFVFNENIKPVNITEMNFIQDINLVEKFVKYRKLEIMKHVRTINYTVEVYKLLSYLIDFEDIINQSITDVKNIYTIKKIDGVNLLNQHKKCKDTLDDIVINNSAFFLNTTLCRFKELEIKLSEIKNRIQIDKDK
jgi:hypothetical protein